MRRIEQARNVVLCGMGLWSSALTGQGEAQTVTYSYDALGRLNSVNRSNGSSAVYAYDAAGNRVSVVMGGQSNPEPDTTPDAISPPNQSLTVNAHESFTAGAPFTISGISAPITLRFTSALTSTSGNVSSRQMIVVRTTASGVSQEWFVAAPGGTLDVAANNGDQFWVKGFLATSSGRASSSWQWTVSNQAANGGVLGGAAVTQVVDNENNYNVVDTTPDAIFPPNQSLTVNAHESFTAGAPFTISGISAPITLRFTSALTSTSGNVSSRQMIVVRTTASGVSQEWFVAAPGGTLDVAANNGDQFWVKGFLATSSGRASSSWQWTVSNQAANGGVLGGAAVTQVVDNENNYNVKDTTPDEIAPLPSVSGISDASDAYFGYDYRRIIGITTPITLRIERYVYSGDADLVELLAVRSPDAQNWTNIGPVNALQTDIAYVDLIANNGDYVGWKVRVMTLAGRKTASMRVVIWNRSAPGGPVIISDTPSNVMVVNNNNQ